MLCLQLLFCFVDLLGANIITNNMCKQKAEIDIKENQNASVNLAQIIHIVLIILSKVENISVIMTSRIPR